MEVDDKNEMIWVSGHNGSPHMGFHVTRELRLYVEGHRSEIDYMYNRKGMQRQFDAIQERLDAEK